nr:hypothetical protein [uncultured Chryseobacterium sp.]
MKEKKLNKLVLNKKVISKLNQIVVTGGQLITGGSTETITGLVGCPGPNNSQNTCGTNTGTDIATRNCG